MTIDVGKLVSTAGGEGNVYARIADKMLTIVSSPEGIAMLSRLFVDHGVLEQRLDSILEELPHATNPKT